MAPSGRKSSKFNEDDEDSGAAIYVIGVFASRI